MERSKDWMRQAKKDLKHAKHSFEAGDYEWACFASQQAAEKAVKAVYQKIGADAWGHSVSILLAELPPKIRPDAELIEFAKELDKYYIPTRYPNFHPSGAPLDYYTKREVARGIDYAKKVISFCEDKIL
ncbi:MAG: HEPN domain-containing protein [bacterium]|nr:HEPN domain-containing protein [bacterium]